jgi:hypothetical protein
MKTPKRTLDALQFLAQELARKHEGRKLSVFRLDLNIGLGNHCGTCLLAIIYTVQWMAVAL